MWVYSFRFAVVSPVLIVYFLIIQSLDEHSRGCDELDFGADFKSFEKCLAGVSSLLSYSFRSVKSVYAY